MFPNKKTKLITKKNKPVTVKQKDSKMAGMENFINDELKILQNMKKKKINPMVKQSQPVIRNQNDEIVKNELKESYSNAKLNKNILDKKFEENMNTTGSKFDGFKNSTKFNETTISDKDNTPFKMQNDKLNQKRISSATKPENFVIKFPTNQITNEKTKEILENLNKESKINQKAEFDIKDIPKGKMIYKNVNETNDLKNKKKYEGKLNKIDNNVKKIENKKNKKEEVNKKNNIEEYVEDEYNDFNDENEYNDFEEDYNKNNNEKKDEFEDMFGENAEFNNIDDEYIQYKKKNYDNIAERTEERLKDLKKAITLSEEYINLFEFDSTTELEKIFNNNLNIDLNKKNKFQDAGINTLEIETKDEETFTDMNMNMNLNNFNLNNNNKKENTDNKNKIENLLNENEKKIEVSSVANYQPLTYDAYKFFVHIGPYIENILLNNINKYILQNTNQKAREATGMSKLDKEFIFPEDLLTYIFPNNKSDGVKINFKKFLFFDTKPFQIGIAINLQDEFSSSISSFFPSNESCNLIIIYSIFKNEIEKIFYSFGISNGLIALGESENILINIKIDGNFEIFDLNSNNNNLYLGFEKDNENVSLARQNIENDNIIIPKFELILPIFQTNINYGFTSQIKKIIKNTYNEGISNISNVNKEKLYEIFIIDQTGFLLSFKINESFTKNMNNNICEEIFNNPYIQMDLKVLLQRIFNLEEFKEIEIIDIKIFENIYLFTLTNYGLVKFTIEGKYSLIPDIYYQNLDASNENNMTCFDISETGNIVAGFNDQSVKIFNNKNTIYSSFITNLLKNSYIDKILWSNVICRSAEGKLIRKSLLANFYAFTTKNDFIIFDLNQKKTEELRKVKRLKEMGSKLGLTRNNSIMDMSNSLYTDYSNFILQSDSKDINKGKVEIHKLSLRKQFYEEASINRVNEKILNKIYSLQNY